MKLYKDSDLLLYTKGPKKGKEINPNQKVELRCDCCNSTFFRLYGSVKEIDLCKSCTTINYNKNRDPSIHSRMVENAKIICSGKSMEERIGKEKAHEWKQKRSKASSGKNNPNYGGKYCRGFADNPIFGTYEENYGLEKSKAMKENLSLKMKGSNNPMFGKPAPQGSGNGWQGWYNKMYFSSILELSFMFYCEENGIEFMLTSSKSEFKISYEFEGSIRNYFPDFIINNDVLVEIKPSKLISTKINEAKFAAANKNLGSSKFKIMTENDFPILTFDKIRKMYYDGTIKFIDRYDKKFKEKYL
jgi:hypothetical protein